MTKVLSLEEDNKIFELYIDKLFETGRINEIELYYSQYPELKKNEFILKKMIEGNLLRNRHGEACKIWIINQTKCLKFLEKY